MTSLNGKQIPTGRPKVVELNQPIELPALGDMLLSLATHSFSVPGLSSSEASAKAKVSMLEIAKAMQKKELLFVLRYIAETCIDRLNLGVDVEVHKACLEFAIQTRGDILLFESAIRRVQGIESEVTHQEVSEAITRVRDIHSEIRNESSRIYNVNVLTGGAFVTSMANIPSDSIRTKSTEGISLGIEATVEGALVKNFVRGIVKSGFRFEEDSRIVVYEDVIDSGLSIVSAVMAIVTELTVYFPDKPELDALIIELRLLAKRIPGLIKQGKLDILQAQLRDVLRSVRSGAKIQVVSFANKLFDNPEFSGVYFGVPQKYDSWLMGVGLDTSLKVRIQTNTDPYILDISLGRSLEELVAIRDNGISGVLRAQQIIATAISHFLQGDLNSFTIIDIVDGYEVDTPAAEMLIHLNES